MANQTVYPYGTGGSLPASIGVINDLKTGGADKALAAEQGKVIASYIMDSTEDVDFSDLTLHGYSVGQSGWYQMGLHYAIPIEPGDELVITVQGIDNHGGGWYAFFNDTYTPPMNTSEPIPYAANTTRVWFTDGTTMKTAPADAAYLCVCTKDGGGQSAWQVSKFLAKSSLLKRSEVVNNLTSGGTDVPLSAEQGKFLFQKLPSIPSGLTRYSYNGKLIRVESDKHEVAYNVASTISAHACQGGACYGNYLFSFTEDNTTCWIHNLASKTLVQEIAIPEEQRGFVPTCHCNTVNFGKTFYDPSDDFPVLYVSTGNYYDGYSGAIVYRVLKSVTNDVVSYSLSIVQTLKFPEPYWTEFVVGENDDFYLFVSSIKAYRFAIPALTQSEVVFDYENALESYEFSVDTSLNPLQGRFYSGGKIYVTGGNAYHGKIIVMNLEERTREAIVGLNGIGLAWEPEFPFVWNGKLCVCFRNYTSIFAFYTE